VEKNGIAGEEERVSRAELSVDISRLVARILDGEAVDTAAAGHQLAGKYADLGMSGASIAEAIKRTTGMMGMIREGIERAATAPQDAAADLTGASPVGDADAETGGDLAGADTPLTGTRAGTPPRAALASSAVAALRAFFRGREPSAEGAQEPLP
jgi:hypothetical protein